MDILNIATAYNDELRIYACDSTELVKYAEKIHNLWPTSAAALGRVLTMAAIMTNLEKNDDTKITIKIDGDGPIGLITVVADKDGVKGFCHNPGVYLTNNNGKLLVGEAVGNGTLTVIKDFRLKEPFSSTCDLISGEIANDFAYYFNQSEQTNTAVALGVLFNKEGKVEKAGGYLIQVMPNCKEETISKVETILANIKPISSLLADGLTPKDIIQLLSDNTANILDSKDINYHCDCSKERFLNGIKSLGNKEISEMIDDGKDIEITCNFCNKKYIFTPDDLKKLL